MILGENQKRILRTLSTGNLQRGSAITDYNFLIDRMTDDKEFCSRVFLTIQTVLLAPDKSQYAESYNHARAAAEFISYKRKQNPDLAKNLDFAIDKHMMGEDSSTSAPNPRPK